MVWLQSESDVCASDDKCAPQRGALYYSCAIQAMIKGKSSGIHLHHHVSAVALT